LYQGALALGFSFFFWLRVLDKAEYSAFQSTLNSPIVSYRIVCFRDVMADSAHVWLCRVRRRPVRSELQRRVWLCWRLNVRPNHR